MSNISYVDDRYIIGSTVSEEEETRLLDAVTEAELTGDKLLDTPLMELMNCFGYGVFLTLNYNRCIYS